MPRDIQSAGWIALTALLLAVVGLGVGLAGAQVMTGDVTITDDDAQTVEVDVDFAADTTATVNLETSDGTVAASDSLNGNDGDTLTATLDPDQTGDLELNVTSDDADNVTVNESRLIHTEEGLNVTDSQNESVTVDVEFSGDEAATADVVLETESGTELANDSISYDPNIEGSLGSVEFGNESVAEGNLTSTVTVTNATAFTEAYFTVGDGDDGLFGGTLFGQDPQTVLVFGGIGIALLWVGREMEWF